MDDDSHNDTAKVLFGKSDQEIMFKKAHSESFFLFLTFVVVLLMGAPTVWSLTSQVDIADIEEPVSAVEASRGPASVPPSPRGIKSLQLTQLDLHCSGKGDRAFVVKGGFVQFRGKNCLKHFDVEKLEIVNKSNGYTASVFVSGVNQYQTDLIQLRSGENEITVRYQEPSGKAVEEVLKVSSSQTPL